MALMKHRMTNRVMDRGVKPAHDGTQVLKTFTTAAVGATPFYTVSDGKTMFLTHAMLGHGIFLTTYLHLDIYTAVPAFWTRLLKGQIFTNVQSVALNASYWPPIEIPTGYIFYVAQGANASVRATIHGWEE